MGRISVVSPGVFVDLLPAEPEEELEGILTGPHPGSVQCLVKLCGQNSSCPSFYSLTHHPVHFSSTPGKLRV